MVVLSRRKYYLHQQFPDIQLCRSVWQKSYRGEYVMQNALKWAFTRIPCVCILDVTLYNISWFEKGTACLHDLNKHQTISKAGQRWVENSYQRQCLDATTLRMHLIPRKFEFVCCLDSYRMGVLAFKEIKPCTPKSSLIQKCKFLP